MFLDIFKDNTLYAVVEVTRNSDLTISLDFFEAQCCQGELVTLVRIATIDKGKMFIYSGGSPRSFILGYMLAKVRDITRYKLGPKTTDSLERLDIPSNEYNCDFWICKSSIDHAKTYIQLIADKFEYWHFSGSLLGAPKWLEERLGAYEFELDDTSDTTDSSTNNNTDKNVSIPKQQSATRVPNNCYLVYNCSTNIIRILSEDSYLKFVQDYGMSNWMDNH